MKKQIRAASAILLAVCSAAIMLTACGNKEVSDAATTFTSSASVETTVSAAENAAETKSVSASVSVTEAAKTEAPNAATAPPATVKSTEKAVSVITTTQKATTTKKASSTEVIPEKAKGISLMTKTTPVLIGNSAVVMIQGTAGKKYTIDFYESSDQTADYDGLETKTADSNGFVTWTFIVDNSCETGNRKIVIKEKNSSNYLQTSITVQ